MKLYIVCIYTFICVSLCVCVCVCVQRWRAEKESLLLFFTSQLLKNIVDLGKKNKQASKQTNKNKNKIRELI